MFKLILLRCNQRTFKHAFLLFLFFIVFFNDCQLSLSQLWLVNEMNRTNKSVRFTFCHSCSVLATWTFPQQQQQQHTARTTIQKKQNINHSNLNFLEIFTYYRSVHLVVTTILPGPVSVELCPKQSRHPAWESSVASVFFLFFFFCFVLFFLSFLFFVLLNVFGCCSVSVYTTIPRSSKMMPFIPCIRSRRLGQNWKLNRRPYPTSLQHTPLLGISKYYNKPLEHAIRLHKA